MLIRSKSLGVVGMVLGALLLTSQATAQFPPYDPTKPIIRNFETPPAPVLSPEEELKTIRIAEGFRLELLASEPLIADPVTMVFDPDGRAYVAEMRSYMPDADGNGDEEPTGTVAVLEDTDGDGKLDKRTEFIGGLLHPRSIYWMIDGLLIAENGNIWFCRDTDGDLKSDTRELVTRYAVGNVEHALNGFMPAIDNWLYNAKDGLRLRRIDGKWLVEPTVARGQWGISQDDHGYLIYNYNSQLIRGDLVPCYSPNAHFTNAMVNLELYRDQEIFPIRPNPGINRGYLDYFLRPDGTMILPNANCGPLVYRGDNLPADVKGNVFLNDPAGNFIRRQVLVEENGFRSNSRNAYDKKEFIASTDERFRPVNTFNAPDGTIWMLDMYKGVIQDRAYITEYLKKEARARNLEQPLHMGRIWRIVHETTQTRARPALSKASGAELVALLSHPNAWHRDTAQQLLVQRNDRSVVPELKRLATRGEGPLARLHALWVLEGLKQIDNETLIAVLSDSDPNLRASAAFLSRHEAIRDNTSMVVDKLATIATNETDKIVRLQIAFTLGPIPTAAADNAIEPILQDFSNDPMLLDGLLAGFSGREAEFLASRLALRRWATPEPWREKLLMAAARMLWRQRQPLPVLRLLELIGSRPAERSWQQVALLEGLRASQPGRGGRNRGGGGRQLTLPAAPVSFDRLRTSPDEHLAAAAQAVAAQLAWPGKDGQPLPVLPPLAPEHQRLYTIGKEHYANICAACHHPQGFGDAGKGPPLLDSDWLSNDQRLTRIVLHGIRGPITINGEPFNPAGTLEMPGHAQSLTDEQIAGIITYIKREWGQNTDPVEPATVAGVRTAVGERMHQWTEPELLQLP